MKKTYQYKATGLVYGLYWGGGEGAYQATKYSADTMKDLKNQIKEGVKNGSIDSGMGYESVLGAFMDIEKITRVIIDGKEFSNSEIDGEFFGKLNEKQQDFLIECSFSY